MWHEAAAVVLPVLAEAAPSGEAPSPVTVALIVSGGGLLTAVFVALINRPARTPRDEVDVAELPHRYAVVRKWLRRRGIDIELIATGDENDADVHF